MAQGSASKVARIRRCKHAFWYSDILKLQRDAQSIAPRRGNIIHECLQEHYQGRDWTKPIKDLVLDLENVFDEEREDWANLPSEVYRIMRGYISAYRDIDAGEKTLATEVKFNIPIGRHTYIGYIDRILEDSAGRVWVTDHKTVKTLPKESDLYMDLQTLMYFDACRNDKGIKEILGDRPLAGVIFNHIKTKAPREPSVLKSGSISKAACDTDVATYMETVKRNGLDPKDYMDMLEKLKGNVFFKRTRIPVSEATLNIIKGEINTTLDEIDFYTKKAEELGSKAKILFPRTALKQRCDWDCEYRDLCFGELAGMDVQGIIDEKFKPREERTEDTDGE